MSFAVAFPDPLKEELCHFLGQLEDKKDLSEHACPKGVGAFLPIGSVQEMEQACPHTSRDSTTSENCLPSEILRGLANNGKQVKSSGHFVYLQKNVYLTERLEETFLKSLALGDNTSLSISLCLALHKLILGRGYSRVYFVAGLLQFLWMSVYLPSESLEPLTASRKPACGVPGVSIHPALLLLPLPWTFSLPKLR